MDENKQREIIKQYKQGKGMSDIARDYSVTRQTIRAVCKKAGCEPRKAPIAATCPQCGRVFTAQRNHPRVYCANTCYFAFLQSEAGSYTMSKRQLESVSVRQWKRRARNLIGHDLPKEYVVHHLDGNIQNNDIENLFLFYDRSKHIAFHHRQRKNKLIKPKSFVDGIPSWCL